MEEIRQAAGFELQEGMRLHLMGVGGAGISAIAQVLLDRGFDISGSDLRANERTEVLKNRGAAIYIGHRRENITSVDAVVISSAIRADNPELLAAREAGIPIMKRADFLRPLMAGKIGIGVAGTHGKTTTTAMIAHIMIGSDLDPSVILGSDMPLLERNGRAGSGAYFVVEADEYDHMFLGLRPEIAVITNIDHDHPDIFPTLVDYLDAFCEFVSLVPKGGKLIVSGEDAEIAEMLALVKMPAVHLVTYGLAANETAEKQFDLKASDMRPNQLGGTDFVLTQGGASVGLVRLRVPGLHNVLNAMAAVAVSQVLGLDFAQVSQSLAEFGGVGRRFQLLGDVGGVTVIDDYAHHPTEIKATLAAARQRYGNRRLWAVWQPHTFSRTRLLLQQFSTSFDDADRVIVLDIYKSRETDTLGLDSADIALKIHHPAAIHIAEKEEAVEYLLDRVRPGDVLLTLGAGDGNLVGQDLLHSLIMRVESYRL